MRTESRELLAIGILGSKSRLRERIEFLLRRGRTFSPRASVSKLATGAAALALLLPAASLAPRWIAFAEQKPQSSFEVSSIKVNRSGDEGATWRFASGGRLTGESVPLHLIISTAFHLKDSQLTGLSGWEDSERYDIEAKAEGNPGQDQLFSMLQELLRERFQLRYHRETREMPVYVIAPAKGGIRLQESKEGSCVVPVPGALPQAPGQPLPNYCGTFFSHGGQVDGTRITMSQLIAALALRLDRPLVDRTGFTKTFDVHLTWDPEADTPGRAAADNGPSVFAASQKQLGLKLEATRAPVEMLVIDHVEKPDAN